MIWVGRWLVAVGLIHSVFGLVVMRGTLAVLWSEGLLDTVNGQPDREAAFWFLCTGFVLLIAGALVHALETRRLPLPPFVAASFAVLTAAGLIIMPRSGIWLLLPPVAGMLSWRGRSARGGESRSPLPRAEE